LVIEFYKFETDTCLESVFYIFTVLSDGPSFLEFVTDFLFLISYKSVWISCSNL